MTTQQTQSIDNETGEILNTTTEQVNRDNQANQVPSKSVKRFVDEMVYLVGEIEAVNDSLKDLKQQAKDQGHNPALLLAVAKALAAGKGEELEDKSKSTLKILDEVLAD